MNWIPPEKNGRQSGITWKPITSQWRTWARQSSETDTLFWQLSIEHDTDVQNQVKVWHSTSLTWKGWCTNRWFCPNQIFLDVKITKFFYPLCSAVPASRAWELRYEWWFLLTAWGHDQGNKSWVFKQWSPKTYCTDFLHSFQFTW